MSVEVNPVGMHCAMACRYCYELPVRKGTRNARPPSAFFALPPNRVVELGLQIEL